MKLIAMTCLPLDGNWTLASVSEFISSWKEADQSMSSPAPQCLCALIIPSTYQTHYNDRSFSMISNSVIFQGYDNNLYIIFGYNSQWQLQSCHNNHSEKSILYGLLWILRNGPLMFGPEPFILFQNQCSCVLELMKDFHYHVLLPNCGFAKGSISDFKKKKKLLKLRIWERFVF